LKRCLLVANADGAMTGLYDAYFSNVGYRVETVSDGLACMSRIRQSLPDLLLLDQELPSGGGEGVLACLREDNAFARVPVVLVADVIPIQDLARLLIRPVVRCLEKRCPVATLHDCINSALAAPARNSTRQ
jgi:CheY-like chemotaxis protein